MKANTIDSRVWRQALQAGRWAGLCLLGALVLVLGGAGALAADLESQWQKLPEVSVKPEGGIRPPTVSGGSQWQNDIQTPDAVPVKFSLVFKSSECDVFGSLAGQQVTGFDGYPSSDYRNEFLETDPREVKLTPYKTYELRIWSNGDVYMVNAELDPPALNDLFSSKTAGRQPARLYNVYYFNNTHQAWEKICPGNGPGWGCDSWAPVDQTFQIQIRPDLGARPVTKPGARQATGLDQTDDAWTRDEPAVDAQTAPGDGEALQMSSSKLGNPTSVRFKWVVALGRIWSGSGAGRIRISESRLGTNVYTPAILTYAPPASQTNEIAVVMDLDDTNCLSQISAPQTLVTVDPLYGSALLSAADLLNVPSLVQKLTNSQPDQVSQFLWTNFSTSAQQVLTNSSSTLAQQQSTLVTELNRILQGSSIYDSQRFSGVSLSGRTRRLALLVNPQGDVRTRLNRFLLEDAYPSRVARLGSTQFDLNFYLASAAGPVDSLGFFTLVSGSNPFVTWRLGLPEGTTNQWRMQEIRNGATNTSLLAFTPVSGLWTLTRGTGTAARVETRTILTNRVAGVSYSTETQEVKNGANVVCDRTVEVYRQFDWGYELVTVTNDPGGANLVTTFNFYSDTNVVATAGKIQSIIYPDGFWERREYSFYDDPIYHPNEPLGALLRVVQPWENSDTNAATAGCLVTDYGYSSVYQNWSLVKWHAPVDQRPDSWPANFSETYDPSQIGILSDYGIYSEKTFLWSDLCAAQDLITETHEIGSLAGYGEFQDTTSYGPSYGRLAGQVFSKVYDTARKDLYDYEFGAWDASTRVFTPAVVESDPNQDVRQIIFHGISPSWSASEDVFSLDEPGSPMKSVALEPGRSTMEVRVIQGGNLAAKELYVYAGNLTDFALIDQVIYQRDCLGHATNVFRVDPAPPHQSRVIYQADWQGNKTWPTDLKLSETDETGIVYTNAYDSLKRLQAKTKLAAAGQSPLVTTLSYDAAGRTLTTLVSGGSLSLKTTTHFDLAGRLTDETSPGGLTTTYSYQNGGRQTTITQSSGSTTIISKNFDRQVASVTGTAVTNQFYHYAVDLAAPMTQDTSAPRLIKTINLGADNSARWTGTYTDHRGHVAREFKPAFANTNSIYKNFVISLRGHIGQPDQVHVTGLKADGELDPLDGFVTGYTYDLYGQRTGQNIDGPDWGTYTWGDWNLASTDRITTWTNYYESDGQGTWFHVAEQWTYPYDNDATPSLVERTRQRLTGFSATDVSETQTLDADTNQTTVKVTVNLPNKTVTTTTTVAQSALSGVQVAINGLLQSESTTTVATPTYHYYDSLGREIGVKDPLGNLSGTRYDPFTGQVTATTNAQGLVTTLQYYQAGSTNAGLLYCQTGPTGKKTYYNYNGAGQVIQTWGDVPYPEKRDYSQYGELVKLTTYRGGTSWSGTSWPANTGPTADATQWFYDEATGLLTNKTDAAGRFVSYDYYDNYYPKSRIWARGVGNTNIYSSNGDLIRVDYSDGTSVAFTSDEYPDLNRLGKPAVVIDASGTTILTYDHAGRLVSTYCTNGLLAGITVTNHFDPVHGRDAMQVLGLALPITHNFAYEPYGRLGSVSSGIYSASYEYKPNSDLLQTTTCKSNTTVVLTTTRTWETGPRLRSIVNVASNTVVTSHDYGYDALDRRKSALLEDGSRWQYGYDDRDELTTGRRYWSDWLPVSGQQFEYNYDNIGNRTLARSGGDTNGANLREAGYTINSLNQYTAITTPGYEGILGVGMATNTVGVTNLLTGMGGMADRKGEYFHREIAINNTNAPVWQSVKVACGGSNTNGGLVFPAYNQTLTYDLDGNLTFDGVWNYQWDAENRLRAMFMTNTVVGLEHSNRLRLDFVYDYQGRRVSKAVSVWGGDANGFTNVSTTLFVYDGWNLVAMLDSLSSIRESFLWGQDLSGTMEQAGGIGGLVSAFEIANNQISDCHFASYDGNGNVTALVRAADKWVSARYEYSPYGEPLRITGPMAKINPFRFSTKFADDESENIDCGLRYYQPGLGRWINRDPIEENGGNNLYTFCLNRPISEFDPIGTSNSLSGELNAGVDAYATGGGSLLAEVTLAVAKYNDVQRFTAATIDSAEGEQSAVTDLFVSLLNDANQMLSHDFFLIAHQSGANTQMHHIFPQAFREQFEAAGINIDKWKVRLRTEFHQSLHGNAGGLWNAEWDSFLSTSPGKRQMFRFAQMMLAKYGIK